MARSGFRVMDSDMHVIEPPDLWARYMDPALRDQAPVGLAEWPRDVRVRLGDQVLPAIVGGAGRTGAAMLKLRQAQSARYAEPQARGFDAASQVAAMDHEGIDVTVLFPSRALYTAGVPGTSPALEAAMARAYNDWLADFCREAPGRMYGAGVIGLQDVGLAVAEATRCVERHGFRGVFTRPNLVSGRNLHDPVHDPLWARLEALGVPICFHDAMGASPQVSEGFEGYLMRHTCCHPMGMMLAMTSMIAGGVLERFPRLRVAFLEANCAWVPWLLWRLDEHLELTEAAYPELARKPSEYFARQCWVSLECDELPALSVLAGIEDNVVFSTDYPHHDAKYPEAVNALLALPLSETQKRKVLWDNCARLYAL